MFNHISFVKSVHSTTCEQISIEDVLSFIKNGFYESPINKIRKLYSENNKVAANRIKLSLPAALFSGVFSKRSKDGLIRHSGLLVLDFDKLQDAKVAKEKIKNDPHVFAAFISPSGNGLKVLCKIEGDHEQCFETAKVYFEEEHDLFADPSGKDVSRLCFLSHDPNLVSNPSASAVFTPFQKSPVRFSPKQRAFTLIRHFQGNLRYIPEYREWIEFSPIRGWQSEGRSEIRQILALSDILEKKALSYKDEKERNLACAEARKFADPREYTNYLRLVSACDGILTPLSAFDADPMLLGTLNGVVNLGNTEFREYQQRDLILKRTKVTFDADAICPRWEQFLSEIFPNGEVRNYIHKYCGYSLTGSTQDQTFLFLYGFGSNGKGTFLNTLRRVMGTYGRNAGAKLLFTRNAESVPDSQIADIHGARVIIQPESPDNPRFNEELIKTLCAGDIVTGRALYKNSFDFNSTAKIWIAGNQKPIIKSVDDGIWRRVRLIPFDKQFTREEIDYSLSATLENELPGILNWMIRGCNLWQREGLNPPDIIVESSKEYRAEEDFLNEFIALSTAEDHHSSINHNDLFKKYIMWCDFNGIDYKLTSLGLKRALDARKWKRKRTSKVSCLWTGRSFDAGARPAEKAEAGECLDW